jgi:glutamine synthetase
VAFVQLTTSFRKALDALDEADNFHTADAMEHARYMKSKVVPLMTELRTLGDLLETQVASSRWPLPSYRELLFIK